jgi:hypothetical protein
LRLTQRGTHSNAGRPNPQAHLHWLFFDCMWSIPTRGVTCRKIMRSAGAGATSAARSGSICTANCCISGSTIFVATLPKACGSRTAGEARGDDYRAMPERRCQALQSKAGPVDLLEGGSSHDRHKPNVADRIASMMSYVFAFPGRPSNAVQCQARRGPDIDDLSEASGDQGLAHAPIFSL